MLNFLILLDWAYKVNFSVVLFFQILYHCLQLLRSVLSDCLPTNLTWICSRSLRPADASDGSPCQAHQQHIGQLPWDLMALEITQSLATYSHCFCFWILWLIRSHLLCCCIISFHLHVKQVDTVFLVLPHFRIMPCALVRLYCQRCIVNWHAFALGRTAVHRQPDSRQNCMCWFTLRLKFLW